MILADDIEDDIEDRDEGPGDPDDDQRAPPALDLVRIMPTIVKGTPSEIASNMWEHLCLPIVAAMGRQLSPEDLTRVYAGFVGAAWGSMVADFGHEQAVELARVMLASFEKCAQRLGHGTGVQ